MSQKKAIVRRFTTGILYGYLPANGFVRDGALELLDLSGRVSRVPLAEVKQVSFVRDFNTSDLVNPERMIRKTFQARPRTEGLWVRMTLRDEDVLEGQAALDLSLLDGVLEDEGLQFAPPDIRGNVQRMYVPRAAITSLQVVAVVTSPSRKKAELRREPEREEPQEDLFTKLHTTRLQ